MRKASCRHCGEKWHPTRGTMYEWWRRHAEMHGLDLPYRLDGEPQKEHMRNFVAFCQENFEGLILEGSG